MHGGSRVLWDGATQAQETILDLGPASTLIVWHEITGGATGGHVEVDLCSGADGADALAYPATGTTNFCLGVPDGDQAASYVAIYKALSRWVKVRLHVADGQHRVVVQALA